MKVGTWLVIDYVAEYMYYADPWICGLANSHDTYHTDRH